MNISLSYKRANTIEIFNNDDDFILDFENLKCPFGIEEWNKTKILNIELDNTECGTNLKKLIFSLENNIISVEKCQIDLLQLEWTSLIKNDKYLRINVKQTEKNLSICKNDIISGKIFISKIWIYKNTYGLYATLL
jgi:hypothetical protein